MCAVQAAFLAGDLHRCPAAAYRDTMLPRWMIFDSMTVNDRARAGAAHLMRRALRTVEAPRGLQSRGSRLAWNDARLLGCLAYG